MVCALPPLMVYVTTEFGVPVNVTVAGCPEQMVALPLMEAVGAGSTVMVEFPVSGREQVGVPEVATLIRLMVVFAAYVPVSVAVPDAFKVMVCAGPPLMLYVTTAFGVPVKVTVAGVPGQTDWLLLILATGSGMTLMITDPVAGAVHAGVPAEVTLTSVTTVFDVYAPVSVAFPLALRTMVWLAPPFNV